MEELFRSLSESVSEECYDEIVDIVEEIINEVSAKKWVETAQKVLKGRAEVTQAPVRTSKDKENMRKAQNRLERAQEIAGLKTPSKLSAQKVLNAARNSVSRRAQEFRKDKSERNKERYLNASNLTKLDPTTRAKNKNCQELNQRINNLKRRECKKERESNNCSVVDKLEGHLERTKKLTGQAKTDHENAQINQGLRNKLEGIYKNK